MNGVNQMPSVQANIDDYYYCSIVVIITNGNNCYQVGEGQFGLANIRWSGEADFEVENNERP